MTRILVVDNHDSFVHILVDLLQRQGAMVRLVQADRIDPGDAAASDIDGVLVSPGPGRPADAGASIAVICTAFRRRMPLLGVCLGHQALAEAFGGAVSQAPELVHGAASQITHDGTGVFAGIPDPFAAGRYHSLAVTRVPEPLRVTAHTDSGIVMGLAHREAPLWGVQFHPESVLTEHGERLLANWLTLAAASRPSPHPSTTRA